MNKEIKIKSRHKRKNGYVAFNMYESINDYKNAFEKFKLENGYYPSTVDIDKSSYFPPSKTIQRKFGSVKKLRELLGFTGSDADQRTGTQRKSLASKLNEDNISMENKLYEKLLTKYEEYQIHRQEPYTMDISNLSRSDFGVYDNNKHFYIDIFTPKDDISLYGCVNLKLKKFKKYNITSEIYLVIGNPQMTLSWLISDDAKKTRGINQRLPENVKLLTFDRCESLIDAKFIV